MEVPVNKKQNETLEEIAKTLFKSWFIDFDPVRAKAEGRSTGLSKEISDSIAAFFEYLHDHSDIKINTGNYDEIKSIMDTHKKKIINLGRVLDDAKIIASFFLLFVVSE